MYRIAVTFRCLPGKREEFVARVKAEGIRDAVLAEDGCYGYDYYFSDADASELLLLEAWETRRHQEVHIEQPHMAKLRSFKAEYIESTELREFELK